MPRPGFETLTRALCSGAVVALFAGALSAEQVRIPGTRVSLALPEGFELSQHFSGIQSRRAGSSVLVAELPVDSRQLRSGMNAEQLAASGVLLESSEEVESAIGPGTLLTATQTAQGTEFRTLILATGNTSASVRLTATAPAQLWERMSGVLRSTLLQATWEPRAEVDPLAALGFGVQPTEDLEPTRSLVGAALLVTENSGRSPRAGAAFAVLTRTSAPGADSRDLSRIARVRLSATQRLSKVEVLEESPLTMAGMPAHELVASALFDERATRVYQAVAFDGDLYWLVQGMAREEEADRFLPQFRQLAQSLDTGTEP